jgi:hypothetical protein
VLFRHMVLSVLSSWIERSRRVLDDGSARIEIAAARAPALDFFALRRHLRRIVALIVRLDAAHGLVVDNQDKPDAERT